MPYVANDLLDMADGRGQRAEWVEFEVHDRHGNKLGDLEVVDESEPSITVNTTANIVKQLSGLVVPVDAYGDINPFSDRIAPVWCLEDGTRWKLGKYRFTGAPEDDELVRPPPLFDSGLVLDAKTYRPFGVEPGRYVSDAIRELWFILGFHDAFVAGSDARIGSDQPVGWMQGQQPWSTIMRYLHELAGFVPPYFDNDDVPRSEPPKPLVIGAQTIRYATDGPDCRILPRPRRDPNMLDAPNRYIVVSGGATTDEVFGTADVDPALPFSKENRGYIVPEVRKMQGLESTYQATVIAQRMANTSATQFETTDFKSFPDPRHEAFEVLSIDDVPYREVSYTLQLVPGGDMQHRATRSDGTVAV